MPDFLACLPNVFVVREEYQILVNVTEAGVLRLFCGETEYYEEGSGLYATERLTHKFCLPQKALDTTREYRLVFRAVPDRKPYFTEAGEERSAVFAFRPVAKEQDVRVVYVSDVHGRYDAAARAVSAFGETDLIMVNGDLGEISREEDLLRMNEFMGRLSGGVIPILYGRGNHDTRGRLAERLPAHVGTDGKKTYFPYRVGPICGIVVDWGEDKTDDHVEYGGVNCFEHFRRVEARDLSHVKMPDLPYRIVMSHVPFICDSAMHGPFDIMEETAASLHRSIARIRPDMMIAGHTHRLEYYPANTAEGCKCPHNYPIVVGIRGATREENYVLTGFVLKQNMIECFHLSEEGKVLDSFRVPRAEVR